MEDERTPLPWRIEDGVFRSINGANVIGFVPARMKKADRNFILKAGNLHDESVELLRLAYAHIGGVDAERYGAKHLGQMIGAFLAKEAL